MLINILKRDLKRKIGMNIIITIFLVFATMFIAGSVNNIVTSTTALDKSMDLAGLTDAMASIIGSDSEKVEAAAESCGSITDYKLDKCIVVFYDNIEVEGAEDEQKFDSSTVWLQTPADSEIKYFRTDGSVLTDIEPGEIYIATAAMDQNDIKVGDRMTITIGDASADFRVAGGAKDAITGARNMGVVRFFISEPDYRALTENSESLTSINVTNLFFSTSDAQKTEEELQEKISGSIQIFDRATLKLSYIVDTIVAAILLAVSIVLIVIAFVMVRFTIKFTLSEEFREIGVMKAIGIKDSAIRGLYISKYFLLTIVGVVIGLALSFPFGSLLSELGLSAVVLENNAMFLVNIGCAVITVMVTMLFCYSNTSGIRQMSPVDTIRSSETDERSTGKSPLRLSRTRKGCKSFMAFNDILSSRKQFVVITVVFALFAILIMMISTLIYTFTHDGLFCYFGFPESTSIMLNQGDEAAGFLMNEGGLETLRENLAEIEKVLNENGMPAKCSQEVFLNSKIQHGDVTKVMYAFYSVGTDMTNYSFFEGTAPENGEEIALSTHEADMLDVKIGDTVKMTLGGVEKDKLVTATYETLINIGQNCRIYNGTDVSFTTAVGCLMPAISFTDSPDQAEIDRRIEKIEELFPDRNVYTRPGIVDEMIGVTNILDTVKLALILIMVLIIVLVVVLMEKSFTIKEKTQIALLKAEGFTNGFVYGWHTLRFTIISVVASVLGMALFYPVTQIISNPLFRTLGLGGAAKYEISPIEVFVIYPLVIIGTTALTAFIATLGTGRITPADTANID